MKKSGNLDLWFVFTLPIILIFLFLVPYFIDVHYEQPRIFDMGNKIISTLKSFRESYHRLPTSLEEIGIKGDDLSIFTYKKIDDRDFEIIYELSLGDVSIFHSNTNNWEYK
jgi:hypothetical protein